MSACPRSETLKEFLRSELPESELAEIQEHIGDCSQCKTALDILSDDPDLLRLLSEYPRDESRVSQASEVQELLEQLRALPGQVSSGLALEEVLARILQKARRQGDIGMLGKYHAEAILGYGGMGVVLRCFDPELGRRVAVKVPRPDRVSQLDLQRFEREAQAVAGIEHDNVVRLYSVERITEDLPCLVMEYVDGPTLGQLLEKESLPPRDAARICQEVAEGLAPAHGAKLVHRDIKPGNIIVDSATGRAKITDFGLVRAADAPIRLTATEMILGTLHYLSPEQVDNPTLIDGRTDLYCLGVTLFECLTGEVPFAGTQRMVLDQIVRDEPRPPRRLNDQVPADLETICLKCMEKDPNKRYGSAKALADDLRSFLDERPIEARAVSQIERLWRWCRRNPAVARLAAMVVLSVAVGFGLVAWKWGQAITAQQVAEGKAEEARKAKEKATEAMNVAAVLSGDMASLLSDRGAKLKAKERYLQVLPIFQELARDNPDAPGHQRNLAATYDRLASLCYATGQFNEAEKDWNRALEICRELVDRHGSDAPTQNAMAGIYNNLGLVWMSTGRDKKAREAFEQALNLADRLVKSDSTNPNYRRTLATAYGKLALLLEDDKEVVKAEEAYQEAIKILEPLAKNQPDEAWHQEELAHAYNNMGEFHRKMGRTAAAEDAYQNGVKLWRGLCLANPANGASKHELASILCNLGILCRTTSRLDQALMIFDQALAIQEQLAKAHPEILDYGFRLGKTYANRGACLYDQGRKRECEAAYKAASDMLLRLAERVPENSEYQRVAASMHKNLGAFYFETDRPADAACAFQAAVVVYRRLADANSDIPDDAKGLGQAYFGLALVSQQSAKKEEAERFYRDALAVFGRLAHAHPAEPSYQLEVARTLNNIAAIIREIRPAEAEEAAQNAQQILEQFVAQRPESLDCAIQLGAFYSNRAFVSWYAKKPEETLKWFAKSVEHLEKTLAKAPRHPQIIRHLCPAYDAWADTLTELGRPEETLPMLERALQVDDGTYGKHLRMRKALALALTGDHTKAVAEAKALSEEKDVPFVACYNLACIYSLSVDAASRQRDLSEDKRQEIVGHYAEQAVGFLQQAVQKGYKDVMQLKKDPDFAPLRSRDDFQKLLQGLEAKTGSKKP